jgi:hypothetical protein
MTTNKPVIQIFIPECVERSTTPVLSFKSLPVTLLSYFKIQIAMMMEENEKVDIIAKLDEQEFCLDADELERLHDECEEEVAKVSKGLTTPLRRP